MVGGRLVRHSTVSWINAYGQVRLKGDFPPTKNDTFLNSGCKAKGRLGGGVEVVGCYSGVVHHIGF